MKPAHFVAGVLLLVPVTSCATPPVPGVVRNFTVLGGVREFDDNDAEPVEEHFVLGVEFDTYREADVVGMELGIQHSEDEDDVGGVEFDGESTEFYLGARKTFSPGMGSLHPYVALGGALIHGRLKVSSGGTVADASDTIVAPYAHVGAYWTSSDGLNLGLDYRRAFFAEFEDDGGDIDVDYGQFALTLGWSF